MIYAASFFAMFVFVFFKSFQQLNVVHNNYAMVVPTSVAMAACEVFVITSIVKTGWGWIVLAVGLGGGLGALSAMLIHRRLRAKAGV